MAVTRIPMSPDGEGDEHQQPQQPQPAHPPHALHQHSLSNASTATVDIEAWTVAALESLSIAPIARGTGNALSIPLDGNQANARDKMADGNDEAAAAAAAAAQMKLRGVAFADEAAYGASITPPRRPPSRRDSMRKREALLKGKEGSRQRRRWENDRLLHVPNVQPPLPSDWQVRPTYPVHGTIPYQLAQYWDKGLRDRAEERKAAFAAHRRSTTAATTAGGGGDTTASQLPEVGHVPRDLRNTAKRTPAVKSWLKVLEEPVRQFVVERGLAAAMPVRDGEGSGDESTDPEDEEIVFVGRNGRMRDGKPLQDWKKAAATRKQKKGTETVEERGMVLDTREDDAGGAFKRWLTHSISDYYGLDSKSVMVGNPARRVVYVGVKQKQTQKQKPGTRHKPPSRPVLPPPLWEMF
ncbi:R3H-associated N-terminal domain-containing protein [Madurella fahalii]|uniref:R3H-associated N-terminal domain-containing protein n=1 Tax=Madurella fahalii TaxID=1157608 RepID=A0ABQ0GP93_9PEZI